jgi:uncharacterized protein YbcV (DUF1398 family)
MLNRRALTSVVVALATTITTQSFAQDRGTGATPAAGAKAGAIQRTFTTSDAIPWKPVDPKHPGLMMFVVWGNLETAFQSAMAIRPKVGGFPYLVETLRLAGITRNIWFLPACQSLYLTEHGPVVTVGAPLAAGTVDVPPFDRDALIAALRTDQAGNSTFPEFLDASWHAGVVRYDVDFAARTIAYYGCNGEEYIEDYPAVDLKTSTGS